jgi:ectoine hydroxylase-related dioxygenase (phytanoyl-CoA dioxygenase family)
VNAEAFIEDGYTIVRRVLGPRERASVAGELRRFATGLLPVENPRSRDGRSDEELLETVLAVNVPHRVSAVVRATIAAPPIRRIAQTLAGAHLPRWDASVQHVQSILYNKPPGHPGQPWHQDEVFMPTRDRSLLGVWIALDESTIANGCLWVVPGSHREGFLWPTRLTADEGEHVVSDESFGFDLAAAVAVEVEPGDAVCFNGYTLHASYRNRAGVARRALVHHFCSASRSHPCAERPEAPVFLRPFESPCPAQA